MSDLDNIIRKCKRSNKRAQKELYDQYAPLFLGICMRYANSRDEAEDILQDAFVKIFFKIEQYKNVGSFEGWMKRIVVNTALTYYRLNQKHFHHEDIEEVQESKIDVPSTGDADFTREELFKTIKSLPEGYRAVFNMYAIEGYNHKEIGEMLRISEGTSKSQYSRAKSIIQKKLKALSQVKTKNVAISE